MRDTDERKYPAVFLHIKNEKNDQKSPLYLLEFSDLSKSDTTLPLTSPLTNQDGLFGFFRKWPERLLVKNCKRDRYLGKRDPDHVS